MCLQRRLICKYFAWLNILDCGGWRHCLCSSWLVCRWPMSPCTCWNSGLGWSRSTWGPLQTPRFLWPLCANWLGNNEHKRMERVTQTLQKASRLNLAHVSTTRSQRNHKFCQFYHKVVQFCQCMILSHIRLLFLFSLWNTLKIFEVFLGWLKSCRVAAALRVLFSCHHSGVPIETLALPPGTKGEELTSRGWAESRSGETSMDFGFSFLLHSGLGC